MGRRWLRPSRSTNGKSSLKELSSNECSRSATRFRDARQRYATSASFHSPQGTCPQGALCPEAERHRRDLPGIRPRPLQSEPSGLPGLRPVQRLPEAVGLPPQQENECTTTILWDVRCPVIVNLISSATSSSRPRWEGKCGSGMRDNRDRPLTGSIAARQATMVVTR